MVTINEAHIFLSNQLKFTNWKEIIERDKLEFLKLLVPYYAHNIYFQNITLSSVPVDARKVPEENDIAYAGLNGIGGNCITQNGFLYLLLKALGFDAFIASGAVKGETDSANNHVLCVVKLNNDELYLLDLGVALPFPEPIPLHNLPYTHRAVGNRLMYRKSDKELYECVQLGGSLFGKKYEDENTEYVRYDFTLDQRSIEFFKEPLTDIFTDSENSFFLTKPFLFRYFAENENGELVDDVPLTGDRKFILVRGDQILIGSNETGLVQHASNYDVIKDTILKYFPKLSKESVEKSVKVFNKEI